MSIVRKHPRPCSRFLQGILLRSRPRRGEPHTAFPTPSAPFATVPSSTDQAAAPSIAFMTSLLPRGRVNTADRSLHPSQLPIRSLLPPDSFFSSSSHSEPSWHRLLWAWTFGQVSWLSSFLLAFCLVSYSSCRLFRWLGARRPGRVVVASLPSLVPSTAFGYT